MAEPAFTAVGLEGIPSEFLKETPRVTDADSYEKIEPGTDYLDPKGNRRTKPYRVKDASDYASLPEGVEYVDPEGNTRTSPKYEDLDFTTQTLYNMSATDKERRKALERGYPGKVKENKTTGELYVDEDGTLRRSRGFGRSPGAYAAAQAAPVIGSIAGEIGGGIIGGGGGAVAGSVVPGPGTVAGGVAGLGVGAVTGGAIGGAAGQAFNDSILALAGVYDRSGLEEAGELGLAAMFGGGGTILGGTAAAVAPAAKGAIKHALPKAVASFLGETPENLSQAVALREKGVLVPPSAHMKEFPHGINIVERFDPAFRTQDPLLQSATEHYERSGKDILSTLGADTEKVRLADPQAAVSTEKAGEVLLGRTREELRKADEELRKALEARHAELTGSMQERIAAKESQTKTLEQAAAEARTAAQKVIDAGFEEIDKSSQQAMAAVKSGHNSGSLWQQVAEKIQKTRAGIMARANKMYTEAESLAGGIQPDVEGLSVRAQEFLDELPEGFEGRYPRVVKQLRDWAGVPNRDESGNIIEGFKKEPVHPTWAQLHNLRSFLRSNYNRLDLTPDVRQGTFKFFANRVDEILQGINEPKTIAGVAVKTGDKIYEAPNHFLALQKAASEQGRDVLDIMREGNVADGFIDSDGKFVDRAEADKIATSSAQKRQLAPGEPKASEGLGANELQPSRAGSLQAAAKQLREADTFYRENMAAFNDKRIQAVVDGLDAGLPADPKVLFDTIVKEGRSDLTAKVADMVGPNLWAGVKAADIREMLDQSRGVTGQIDGRRFVSQVLERYRSGMLEAVHGKEVTQKLLQQAQNIEALAGRLDLPVRPGDTIKDVIDRATTTAEAAKQAAKQDPLGTLTKEVKATERQMAVTRQTVRKQLKTNNPLDFLYNESVGASEAVNKILGDEDLIIAAASKFGPDSSEFNLLRQTWAQRLLTDTLKPGDRLAKVSEEVQRIMFPGVSLDQMRMLAKEMDFLMGTRGGAGGSSMAGGMAAMSRVEHPWSNIVGKGGEFLPKLPLADAGGRFILGKYFKFVTKMVNNAAFLRWMEKGLRGDQKGRAMVQAEVQRAMNRGGAIGAGVAQTEFQTPNENVILP